MSQHFCGNVSEHAIIFNGDGHILILQDNDVYQDKWSFPGGRIDEGEHACEGLHREFLEECQLTNVTIDQLVHANFWGNLSYRFGTFYVAHVEGVPPITLSHEHKAYAWVTPEDALDTTKRTYVSSQHIEALKKAIEYKQKQA